MPRYNPRQPNRATGASTPEERLESVVRHTDRDRSRRLFNRIRDALGDRPDIGPWILAAGALRDRGIISENGYYHFVAMFTDAFSLWVSDHDPELLRLERETKAIERANGIPEDDVFNLADAPPEYIVLSDAWTEKSHQLIVEYLRANDQVELATFLATSWDEFEARSTAGRLEVWRRDGE